MGVKSAIQHAEEPTSNAIRRSIQQYVARGHKTFTPTQLVVQRGEGVYLWNPEGKRFLDFSSGVLVTNLGNGHSLFEARYAEYTDGLPRNAYNMLTSQEAEAARRLVESIGLSGLDRVIWADSGSAAIIKAIWAVQHLSPERPIMLATRYGFHGKKGLAGDVTGETTTNPNVRFISFPTCDHCSLIAEANKGQEASCRSLYEKELDELWQEHGEKIGLLITEPYLGAKGSFHPPKWYLQLLDKWCEEHDVVFILDEVQSCHGRTGQMYAFQTYEITPDLVALGKGIGNGVPLAAVVGTGALLDSMDYGEGSDTFSGNPHACAAALAVLDVFHNEDIVGNCQLMGMHMKAGLEDLKERFPFITFVRGEGLVWGVEMSDWNGRSGAEIATECVLRCYEEGLHLMGPLANTVLRVSPPLTITLEELKEGIDKMVRALARVEAGE